LEKLGHGQDVTARAFYNVFRLCKHLLIKMKGSGYLNCENIDSKLATGTPDYELQKQGWGVMNLEEESTKRFRKTAKKKENMSFIMVKRKEAL